MTATAAGTTTATEQSLKEKATAYGRALIEQIKTEAVRAEVRKMRPGGTEFLSAMPLLPPEAAGFFLAGMQEQQAWKLEKWLIFPDESVRICSDEEFEAAAPETRFSYNDCLRKLPPDAYHVRGLISAMASKEVASALSEAYGSPIFLKGIDMARYTEGHYLRRHADTFNDRHFGLIFFLAADWAPGDGGELVVEAPTGEARVAFPKQGDVALLRISPGFHHKVCQVRSSIWTRYVLSVHFGSPAEN
jgi:hypothetical protein